MEGRVEAENQLTKWINEDRMVAADVRNTCFFVFVWVLTFLSAKTSIEHSEFE